MAGQINEYTNTASAVNTGSFFDIDQLISTGPNVYQSQKVPAALMKQLMLSENIEQILLADMQTKATNNELVSLKSYLIDGADGGGRLIKVIAASGVTNQIYQTAIDVSTGEIGNYNLTDDTFFATNGLIVTISKANFDDLITNSQLVIGQQYIVIGAFTSVVFARDWDILCIADSVNTVKAAAQIVNISPPIPCEYDPFTPLVKLNDAISNGLIITPTVADTWASITPYEVFGQTPLTVLTGGGDYIEISTSDDPTVLLLTNARLMGTGVYGTYDPATDTFTPNSTIVSFKITLTDTQIKAGGYFDIDEMPSVSGAYWQFCECFAVLSGQTTPYDGVAPTLFLLIDGAGDTQISDLNDILASGNGDGSTYLTIEQTFNTLKVGKGQVKIKTGSTNGDGVLTVYGTARLVTL